MYLNFIGANNGEQDCMGTQCEMHWLNKAERTNVCDVVGGIIVEVFYGHSGGCIEEW